MMEAASTYRAVHAVSAGRLELTEKTLQAPGPGKVRIRVEACGVCHSDSGTVEALFPIDWPRVPGHEVVGRIDALGSGVQGWAVGQRVGVGFLGGSCGYCQFCREGDLVNCRNQEYTGIHHDGGYAEVMIAKASGLVSIPDDLSSVDAAPLLCAGLTTFSALRNAPAKAGDLVAVVGIGGLGHLGVQYARRMGFEVAAIARGGDMVELAKKLGAHPLIDGAAKRARRGSAGARQRQSHSDNGVRREDGRRDVQGPAPQWRLDRPRRRAGADRGLEHGSHFREPQARRCFDRRPRDR
jgi:propanol-preferring alcohol dehydrogenase